MKAKKLLGINDQEIRLSNVAVLTKYYQGVILSMQRNKKGKAYAETRALDYERLRIGFCGYDVGKSWSGDYKSSAIKLGLDKVKNCLIFPTKNKVNQIVSIYGRSISQTPVFAYLQKKIE